MRIKLGLTALVAGAGAAVYVATRPDTFRIERSALITAPPDAVFSLLNDFRRWMVWSPYERLDPHLERSYSGPGSGPGASYAWKGRKAGEGRMTLLETQPGRKVVIRVEFVRPMVANNRVLFELTPSGNGTRVRWSMEGTNSLLGKMMAPFVERIVGRQFEEGLRNLDRAARLELQRQSMEARTGFTQPGSEPAPLH